MSLPEFKKIVHNKLNEVLKHLGFKRAGGSFILNSDDLVKTINVQSSTSSNKDNFKFTINLYLRSIPLSELEETSLKDSDIIHFQKRIGSLMTPHFDHWCTISNYEEANKIAEEVSDLVKTLVIPELRKYKTTEDLIESWKRGESFGITHHQTSEYIAIWRDRKK